MNIRITIGIYFLLLLAGPQLRAQQTGLPPFGSFQAGGLDTINLQNVNVNFSIPIVTSPGRGQTFSLPIVYDSLIWIKSSSWIPVVDGNGNPSWGWKLNYPAGVVAYSTYTIQFKCFNPGPGWFWATKTHYGSYTYTDPAGTKHLFSNDIWVDDQCWNTTTGTLTSSSSDASGYYLDSTTPISPILTNPDGIKAPVGTVIDTNGNYITQTPVGSETDWTDTVGRVAAKVISGTGSIQYKFLDGSGTSSYQTATLVLTPMSIKTNFGCSVGEYNSAGTLPQVNLPTELDIPTPSGTTLKYLFSYEPTPQNSGYYTGRLQKVTLPSGGIYEYDYGSTNDGVSCSDGSVVSMTRKMSDGTTTGTWQYTRNTTTLTTTVTDAANNDAVYTFNSSAHNAATQLYSGTGAAHVIQKTIYTTWAANGTPATSVVMLEDSSTQSETDTTFDSNGLLDSMTEYDWGAGVHGSALRTTTLSYLNSTNYTTRNIINRVATTIIKDGTGTIKYREDIGYDGATITNCPTGVSQHDDTHYGCSMNYRGNPTSVTVYKDPVTPSQGVVTSLTYDVFGNVLTSSLSGTQQQQFIYSSATKYASPDSVVSGPSSGTQLTQTLTYKSDTGLIATSKDPNNQQTSFAYDFLRRTTSVTRPDNSQVTSSYNDASNTVTVTTPIDSSRSIQQITALDSLGRPVTSTLEDGNNSVYSIVQTNYDAMGRPYRASNPYTGSPSYWTTTTFDALSRPVQVQLPDSSTLLNSYTTDSMTATDPAGKARKSVFDGAGRLAKVFEPDVANGNSLTVETDYSYTTLNALSTVTQGVQTRTNTYDALGRLASVLTPEAGTVCLGTYSGSTCQQNGYDGLGNLISRTDARGVVANYAYDSLNRLISVSYLPQPLPTGVSAMPNSVCNPLSGTANSNVCFYYDQGGAGAYALGRLTKIVDASGSEAYAYNNLGETTQLDKVIGSTTYTTKYQFNILGELTQITYPSNHVVYRSYDTIGRLCEVAGAAISGNCGTATTPYASGFSYNTAQEMTGFNYGNGVAASFGYSSDRLQMTSRSYAKSGTTLFGLTYAFPASPNNNGQISRITDSVQSGRTASYTYDALGRLSTAGTTGSAGYPSWGLSFSYDRYGNRTAETQTAGSPPSNSLSFANPGGAQTNHPDTYSFDAGGNMLNDGYNNLGYDGENRQTSASNGSSSGAYTYDAIGLRVKKVSGTTTTVYAFSGGNVIAEYENGALPASPTREYIYSGSALLAKVEGGSTIYYQSDHLSTRLITDSSGNTAGQQGHYPFGENWYAQNTTTKWQFTTYERDVETDPGGGKGNDYATARYNIDRFGRFSSEDLLAGSSVDPQSLNRYAYVRNDPINLTDPTGLCPQWGSFIQTVSDHFAPYFKGRFGYNPVLGNYQSCRPTQFYFGFGLEVPIVGDHCRDGWCVPASSGFTFPTIVSLGQLDTGSTAEKDVNKTWSKTFSCNKSATQVMSAVQNDMGQFADNRGTIFSSNFPHVPLTLGGQYAIQPGLNSHDGSGGQFPTGILVVTVTSQSANGWTFTTDPSQHYIDGTVSFSSTTAGGGDIAFSITANGNFANVFSAVFGAIIKAGENSTWNNMLGNVQGYCQSPVGR